MTLKYRIIICVTVVATAFAFGRYSAPATIKIETKTVEVEKKAVDKESSIKVDTKKTTVKKTIKKPDGTLETTITVVVDNSKQKDKKDKTVAVEEKTIEIKKEVTKASDKVTISVLGGVNLNKVGMLYGASISKPILGPITVGVWGLSDASVGASVGLTF